MKKFLDAADDYLKECDWIDIALIKLCLCSIGIVIGLCLPKKGRKFFFITALLAAIGTSTPLIMKFLPFLTGKMEKLEEV